MTEKQMNENTEKPKNPSSFLRFLFFLFFCLSALVILFFVAGVYKFGWENAAAKRFAEIVSLPAAVVAGKPVLMADFWKLREAQKKSGQEESPPTVIADLVRDKAVGILSKEKQIALTAEELEIYYDYLLDKLELQPSAAPGEIERLFGLAESDFTRLVVLPDLKRIKLAIWWQQDRLSRSAGQRAQEIETKLLEGLTFQEAARLESDDEESKYIGGDLGFLAPREIPPWFRDKIVNLKTGDMSRIVVGPDGYYLFQVAARGRDTEQDVIQVKQILIKNDGFEEYLTEQIKRFRVLVFKNL